MAQSLSAARIRARIPLSRIRQESRKVDDSYVLLDSSDPQYRDEIKGSLGVLTLRCDGRVPAHHAKVHPRANGLRSFQSTITALKSPIYTARLKKLHPGSSLLPHRDRDLSFEAGVIRLVVPVEIGRGSSFRVQKRKIPMKSGELWWVDAGQIHEVIAGKEPVILLIMDVGLTEGLFSRFPAGMRSRLRSRAIFDSRGQDFFDPSIRGRYIIPLPNPFLLQWGDGRGKSRKARTRLTIESSPVAKTRMILDTGEVFPLVRDKEGRIRLRTDGPGLFLRKVGSRLLLERRGIQSARADGSVSYYTAKIYLIPERPRKEGSRWK